MSRSTGTYRTLKVGGEPVRAFVPAPLPPARPALEIAGPILERHYAATAAVGQLNVAEQTVPSVEWFLYGFVRKEAVVSSQIEGTQATFEDIAQFEATEQTEQPEDVEEVCNYVAALEYARKEMARPRGLPISSRLLCRAQAADARVRGAEKHPGTIRTSQNWIGGRGRGTPTLCRLHRERCRRHWRALDRWIHVAATACRR
ncbi:MAG: Fic/DOC family N-terminal domain-containing protein [Planctomycetaceae bacterium]